MVPRALNGHSIRGGTSHGTRRSRGSRSRAEPARLPEDLGWGGRRPPSRRRDPGRLHQARHHVIRGPAVQARPSREPGDPTDERRPDPVRHPDRAGGRSPDPELVAVHVEVRAEPVRRVPPGRRHHLHGAVHVPEHGRGRSEAAGRSEGRRLLPDDRRDGQAGRRRPPPTAQPRPHPGAAEGQLEDLPGPVLRPGVAVLRPVHDLHDRHRLSARPHPRRRHPRHGQSVGDPVGSAVLGQGRRVPQLPRCDGDRADEERDHGHEHQQGVGSGDRPQGPARPDRGRRRADLLQRCLLEAPEGRVLAHDGLVGGHGGGLGVRPAVRRGGLRGHRLLVPGRSQGSGRQRPDRDPEERRAPCPRDTRSSTTGSSTNTRWTTSPGTGTSRRRTRRM